MNKFVIIISLLASAFLQHKSPCLNVYQDEYAIFLIRENESWTKIQKTTIGNNKSERIFLGCEKFKIPVECGQDLEAAFVYIDENQSCLIMPEVKEVHYQPLIDEEKNGNFKVKMTVTGNILKNEADKSEEKEITLQYEFGQAITNSGDFEKQGDVFLISISQSSNPVHVLSFLKVLKEHSVVSTVIFFSFGMILCFFGLKFYRDMLSFFIPLIIAILGFYLYITLVEKSVEQNEKMMLILMTLFSIAVFIALAVTFTSVIYVILCILISNSWQLSTGKHIPQDA